MRIACKNIYSNYFFFRKKHFLRGGALSLCKEGYTGPLCSSCLSNENETYYRVTDTLCVICNTFMENVVILVFSLLAVFVILIVMIKFFFLNVCRVKDFFFRFYVSAAEKNSAALSIRSLQSMMMSTNRELQPSTQITKENENTMSVSFKIFMNYLQMIAIVSSFDMKWPFYTRNFFAYQGVGSYSSDFFSLECLVKRKNHIAILNI